MAVDGLKMIHIAGYDGDAEEYFEGLGGGGLDLSALIGLGGESGSPSDVTVTVSPNVVVNVPPSILPTQPIPLPDKRDWLERLADDLAENWTTLKTWLTGQTPYEPPDEATARSLGKARMVPAILGAGALAAIPPAAIAIGAASAINALVSQITEAVIDDIDPTSERWRLAGIENRLKEIRGVLFDGLLVDYNPLPDARTAILDKIKEALEKLKELQDRPPVQEEIDVGDVRIISGKIIEY